ncbi:MAG: hypothetical protein MK206_02870 [Candidatus Poseidoniia archaeon]|nr:hypothetical protein [Candidatus Poseidoniia archaeon]
MKINKRQTLTFVAALVMVVSALAFSPASGETGFSASASGYYNNYSFASVNGTAEYTLDLTNSGETDFTDVVVTPEFQHQSWNPDNVSFSDGSTDSVGSFSIETFSAGTTQQLTVSVTVGNGVQIDYPEVPMMLNVDDSTGSRIGSDDVIIVVANWIAYESNYPGSPALNEYNIGDSYDYQLTVENIAVSYDPVSDSTTPMDIRDAIQVQYSGISGWSVTSDDDSWHPFYGGQLDGMAAGSEQTWDISVELTGNVKAGEDVINFQASSTDPDDPMGGMPYYQPYGLSVVPVSAASWYNVGVSGSGMRNADVSEGSDVQNWEVGVHNIGNADDTFSLTWDVTGVPLGWTLSALPDTSGTLGWQGSYNFDVAITIPGDALAGTTGTFTMTADSANSDTTATQTFEVSVDQHYGVSLAVEASSLEAAPGATVDFSFTLSNTGNGEDTYGISVDGPAVWTPTASASEVMVSAVSDGQFLVSVTIPEDRDAGADSGDITVTVTSSDNETSDNATVSASASQVFDISMAHYSGSDGIVTVSQDTSLQIKLNVTNNGNGVDTLSLSLANAPSWAALGAETLDIGRGQTIAIVVTLSPDTAALSGRDYTFQVVATSGDGSEWTSPDMTAEIEVKDTEGEEVEEEVVEEEDDSPGFGIVASLLAFAFVVLNRRKD